jgi:hypothetical protein
MSDSYGLKIRGRRGVDCPRTQTDQHGWRQAIFLSLCLSFLNDACFGQSAGGLRLLVVEGSAARYIPEQVPETSLSVRLIDRNNRPVPNVAVVFTSPQTGPGGEFVNGLNAITAITNEEGLAVAQLYHPNAIEGTFEIQVRTQHLGEIASATIRQQNVATRKSFSKKVLLLVAAGATTGAALALRRGGAESPSSPLDPAPSAQPSVNTPDVSFGGSSVGAPR